MAYSFIIVKPDALKRQLVCSIMERLIDQKITIELVDYKLVTEELITQHYEEIIQAEGEAFIQRIKRSFIGNHVITIIISSKEENIISKIRKLIGATDPSKAEKGTIRGDFGIDTIEKAISEGRCCENLIHASDSHSSYLLESSLWFGERIAKRFR